MQLTIKIERYIDIVHKSVFQSLTHRLQNVTHDLTKSNKIVQYQVN